MNTFKFLCIPVEFRTYIWHTHRTHFDYASMIFSFFDDWFGLARRLIQKKAHRIDANNEIGYTYAFASAQMLFPNEFNADTPWCCLTCEMNINYHDFVASSPFTCKIICQQQVVRINFVNVEVQFKNLTIPSTFAVLIDVVGSRWIDSCWHVM